MRLPKVTNVPKQMSLPTGAINRQSIFANRFASKDFSSYPVSRVHRLRLNKSFETHLFVSIRVLFVPFEPFCGY